VRIAAAAGKAGTRKSADLVGVGCFEGDKRPLAAASSLDTVTRERIQKALSGKQFSGRNGESFFIPLGTNGVASVFLIGLGRREKYDREKTRRAAAKLLGHAKTFRYETLRIELDSFAEGFGPEDAAAAAVEGLRLSDYRFDKYKTKPAPAPRVAEVELLTAGKHRLPALKRAIAAAEILSEGVLCARDLANEPANVMTPERLAAAAREMASQHGLICRVFDRAAIRRLKMGGVLAVSQGSSHEPRFIALENRAKPGSRPIVLVGKGVTFDSGGISIKPSGDMDKMKFDMSGAAAVIGAMRVIARLKLPVRVVGLAPAVENMPSSTAQRPGDIIRCLNGKTVEVLNTDAEGRLILADALAYAERYKPRAIVDIATLTGACAATFGDLTCGVMGTDPELVRSLIEAGKKTGERCWELPLWDEYFESIRATYADIQNISKKNAGTITAGMFLKEFAGHTSAWAHLDVAGTAWADNPKPLAAVGSTGFGVRLLVELVKSYL